MHALVYSHGHNGYNSAIPLWQVHNEERGDAAPRLVGHTNILTRYARYRETIVQARLASIQFPTGIPVDIVAGSFATYDPTEVFDDSMLLVDGSRRVELIWAPSEVDDALAMVSR